MGPEFYRPPFLKHLHNLAISGFYARDLDADDHAFLEYVRERGIANGDLPRTCTVLVEELDFWSFPYSIDRAVSRRAGPVPLRSKETPEQRAIREARRAEWLARKAVREHDKAVAEAEVERERQEWLAARDRRKMREMLSDAEWEAADPARIKFGKVVDRHYVPQWKVNEDKKKQRTGLRRRWFRIVKKLRKKKIEASPVSAEAHAEDLRRWHREAKREHERLLASRAAPLPLKEIHDLVRANGQCSIEQLTRWTGHPADLVLRSIRELIAESYVRRIVR